MTLFKAPGNARYAMENNIKYSYSCEDGGCDDYCRCSVIEDVTFNTGFQAVEGFMYCAYSGPKDTLTKSLATWFCKQNVGTINWKWTAEGGYYGEELESITLEDDGGFYQRATEFEKLTTKEKIDHLLTKEYKYVLESVAKVHNWHVVSVPVKKITGTANKNLDISALGYYKSNIMARHNHKDTEEFMKANAILCLPDVDGNYKLIDGRHRLAAVQAMDTASKKSGRTRIYVICPSTVGKGIK